MTTSIDLYTKTQADALLDAKADKASLGDASTHPASDFATAGQGAKADTAVQPADIGTAASHSVTDFATASQGAKADTAVQPSAIGSAASHAATDFATAAQGGKADTAVQPAIVDAKGDLLVGTGADAIGRLATQGDNKQLFADSTTASGLRWGAQGELPGAVDISGISLNTVVVPGFRFYGNTCTDTPAAGSAGMLLVTRRQSALDIVLQQVWHYNGQLTASRISYNAGATWSAWAIANNNTPGAGNTIPGTGFPEGIVTAPVGTKYIDTAMTNGARQWIKATGTGNTGWKVFDGDTGWRDASAWLSANWVKAGVAGVCQVRRLPHEVQLVARLQVAATAAIIGQNRSQAQSAVLDFSTGTALDSAMTPQNPLFVGLGTAYWAGTTAGIHNATNNRQIGIGTSIASGVVTAGASPDQLAFSISWPIWPGGGGAGVPPWPTNPPALA